MKNLVGLILVLFFAVESQAQIKKTYERVKQAVTGSAKFGQLHYFPQQWEADLNLGYRYQHFTIEGKNAGLTAFEVERTSSDVNAILTMGVLDNLAATIELGYLVNSESKFTKPTPTAADKSSGIQNPVLGVVFRAVDADSIKLDAKLEFSPDMGDSKEADSTHDGNGYSGGHKTNIGLSLTALATNSSQLRLNVEHSLISSENSVDQTSSEITESGSRNQTSIEILTLTEITSDLFFGLELDIVSAGGYKTTNLTTMTTSDYGSTSAKAINLIGKYLFTPDSLIELQAGYLLDYSGEAGGFDNSVSAYTAAASYQIRF